MLLEGLEINELLLSQVRRCNEKLRIDSGYFSKPILKSELLIRAYANGFDDLGLLFSRFVKGIFEINSDAYVEQGIPFLRILNLRNSTISEGNLAFIPETLHQSEKKTELLRGDVVLSKTAYPAASLVTLDKCNTSQDTIATTFSDYGKLHYLPEAVVAYLNCAYGERLLWRQFQGNVQLHLGLEDGRKVPIPRMSMPLQKVIKKAFDLAVETQLDASVAYDDAEALLLKVLRLESFSPCATKVNVKSFQDSFANTGRLDAEHYQSKYDQLENVLANFPGGMTTVGALADEIANGAEVREYQDEGTPYLRIGDLKFLDVDASSVVCIDPASAKSGLEKIGLKAGDVLLSRSGSLAVSAVVEPAWENALISSHLIRLRIRDSRIDPYFLALFFMTLPGKMQIQKWSNGGVQPEISQPAVKVITVPVLPWSKQQEIRRLILLAREFRTKSGKLLEAAKRAVEIAIEQDEAAGMAYLEREAATNSGPKLMLVDERTS